MTHSTVSMPPDAVRPSPGSGFARWIVVGSLALLILAKLLHPDETLAVLTQLWGFTPGGADVASALLLTIEAAIVLLLLFGRTRRLGAVVGATFLIVVSVSPARQLLAGSDLGCGCGGVSLPPTASQVVAVARNLFLIYLCSLVWQRG